MGTKKKKVRCEDTGEVFESIMGCARIIGVDFSNLSKSIKKNGQVKGKKYSFVDGQASQTKTSKEEQKEWQESYDKASFVYKGEEDVRTLDKALQISQVDLEKWQVKTWKWNYWGNAKDPRYQVKVDFEPKVNVIDLDKMLASYKSHITQRTPNKMVSFKPNAVLVGLADFHAGALSQGLNKTQDFNLQVLVDRLFSISNYINKAGFPEVHVSALGDFIESFTGLNHTNSWKGIEGDFHGMKAVVLIAEVLGDFLGSINNLKTVDLVSGNHDRISKKPDEDAEGQVGFMLAHLLNYKLNDVEINHDYLVTQRMIDGISYISTHGHHGLSKRASSDIILDYGVQGVYNVILSGHWHSRGKKELVKTVDGVISDKASFRSVTLPPLFTGNFYSESNGWTSTAGFNLFFKNEHGFLEHFDVML